MHLKTQLRIWALQADAIATQHNTHSFREKLVKALMLQIEHYQHTNQPLWQIALLDMFTPLVGEYPAPLDHTEAKALLYLIRDTCFFIADKHDEMWYDYLITVYDYRGEPQKPTRTEDPFSDWVNDNITDDDDTQGDDPVPW